MKTFTKKKKKIRSIGYFLSFFFTLFLFGGMFSYTEVGAATRVFYDGFEDGTTNKWDPSGPADRNRCASATSAADGAVDAHAGTRMASCNWNGIVAWNDPNAYTTLSLNSWSYTNEMFIRFWIRLDQDMDNKDGAKLFRLGFGGDSDTFWQRDPVSLNGGTHEVWTVGGNGIINAWSPHNFEDRQWHKIEIYIKSDTGPNGAITVWMDGVLTRSYQYPYTGVTSTGTSRWYPFNLMSNWSNNPGWEHDDKNHVYWDDFEIYSDSSAGSPAIGSLSDATVQVSGSGDTTPPTSPANLAATSPSQSSISVSWTASTDNVGVANYIVERCQGSGCSNFAQVGTPTSSPFVDSGLTANTFYNYHVRARDAANNLSGWSNVVGATTQSGTPAPAVSLSANPTSITSGSSSTLTWSSTNATSCTASGSWTGTKATSGTQSVSPTSTSTYTLTCTGAGGNGNASATVTVSTGGGGTVSLNECQTMQNGWIFCNDFDTNVTTDAQRRAQWDDYDGATDVNFPQDNGPSQNSSNHVAQFLIPQNTSSGDDLVKVFESSYQKLYLRYYTKYASDFPFTMGNHGGGLTAGDRNHLGNSGYRPGDPATPSGSDEWADFRVQYNKGSNPIPYAYSYNVGMYQDCPSSGSCYGDSYPCVYDSGQSYCTRPADRPAPTIPTITSGAWHCVEEMVDMGTPGQSNGQLQLTWNGALAGNLTDMHFRDTAGNLLKNLYLSLYSGDTTHSAADQRIDNIVVSTQPIGCGASGSGDTTPPTSPANLAATSPSQSSISVSWTASTDNVGVANYIVERCQGSGCSNFAQVGTPTSSPFVDSGLTANTFYNYHVRARDATNNLSGWSNVVGATTQSATPVTTLTIDNTDAATSQSGSWSPSTNFPGYYGTNYHYSPNATGHWFEWTASTLSPGTYEVSAYWNANPDRPTDVSYLITHSGGTATRNNINQTQNGSQWNLLGTYTFGTTGTVRVQSGGTGTEGTVADAIRFVKTNIVACNTVTTANFSQSAYNSYGAPFDAFQTSTNLIDAKCMSTDTHTINLTTGITGDTTRIVYTKGYWYDAVTTAWRQYIGTCTGALNGEWCQGSVSATITDPNVSTASSANPTYLVGMTCSVQGGSWKCGCRDTSCTNFSWQIQGAGM